MLYALETELNRQYKAGKPTKDDLISNLNYFPYETDEDGKISSEFLLEMYNDITTNIELIRQGGLEFYMVDIELLANQNVFVVDIIATMSFYLGEGFGFLYFDEDVNYHVLWDSFENEVNDRLIFEAIDDDEYFVTDITPNPSSSPIGLKIWNTDIIGVLNNGNCWRYQGTKDLYGGPELVYGHDNLNTTLPGATINNYIDKAIAYFESEVPSGNQLIRLKFYVSEPNPSGFDDSCISNSCSNSYPCDVYSHKWQDGRSGRIVSIAK